MKTNKTKILFIGPVPPPKVKVSNNELSTKQLLESYLKNQFDIIF